MMRHLSFQLIGNYANMKVINLGEKEKESDRSSSSIDINDAPTKKEISNDDDDLTESSIDEEEIDNEDIKQLQRDFELLKAVKYGQSQKEEGIQDMLE